MTSSPEKQFLQASQYIDWQQPHVLAKAQRAARVTSASP